MYFDSLGIEYIPLELSSKMKGKHITHKIFRIQDDDSIICFAGKTLLDYTLLDLFSPNDYQKNDQIIYKYFKDNYSETENVDLGFRLKRIDETRNYLLSEIKHNDLMSEKHRNVCSTLIQFEHFLFFCFCCQWLCFNFCICFINWCSYRRYCKFCSW